MKHVRGSKRFGKTNRFVGKILALDKFSYSVPSFNLRGDQSIKTGLGAFCSVALSIVVLFYALLKFIQLQERHNPSIATFPVEISFGKEDPINLNAINFKAAFQFLGMNQSTGQTEVKDDSRFVKMLIR